MDLKLNTETDLKETIDEVISIPVSKSLKEKVRKLQNMYGKKVNKKAREFFESLVEENLDKIKSAS